MKETNFPLEEGKYILQLSYLSRPTPLEKKREEEPTTDSIIWNVWKNSLGSVFDGGKEEEKKMKNRRRKSDTEKEAGNPILGKIGEIATRSLVKYLTNEISNLFTSESS